MKNWGILLLHLGEQMKNLGKILALTLVCGMMTLILVACGSKLDASSDNHDFDQDQTTINNQIDTPNQPDNTENNIPDDQTNENNVNQTDPENNISNNQTDEDDTNQTNTENDKPKVVCQHQHYHWVVEEATCTQTGLKKCICDDCTECLEEILIDVLEHDYEVTWHKPTCTEPGYNLHHCRVCGDEKITDEQPATGHQESTEHPHQCEICGTLLISPLQNLSGSHWYYAGEKDGLEFYFKSATEFETYKYTKNDQNDSLDKKNHHSGTYYIDGNRIHITVDTIINSNINADFEYEFDLTYDYRDGNYIILSQEKLFNSAKYSNITLIFTEYAL